MASAVAQYNGGIEAWIRSVRMELFRARKMRSALTFCGHVYGHKMRNKMTLLTFFVPLIV